ncbi:MAG: iron ABC transporter permease [Motiliproteus sp.]
MRGAATSTMNQPSWLFSIPLRVRLCALGLMIACVLSFLISLSVGSFSIPLDLLLSLLSESSANTSEHTIERAVVMELRLPRALSAMVVGAQLALAGCLMQALLRNPLADPYVLGVSGGASVAAMVAILFGLGGFWISGSALFGAMLNMILVFGLVQRSGRWSSGRLLLTGIVIASGWGAMVSFLLAISDGSALKGMLFWLMGDFSHSGYPGWNSLWLLIGLVFSLAAARPLNILVRGELQAKALGVDPRPLQVGLYLLTSLLTASAVTQAGSIGFLGLVVPHLVRLAIGADHRWLLPCSALAGATLLLLADTLARTLIAPQQLPVGVITALLGVPLFLFLLNRHNDVSR